MTDSVHIKSGIDFYSLWKSKGNLIKCGFLGAIAALILFFCISWKTEYTAMLRIEPDLSTTGESTSIEEEMDVIQAWSTVYNAVHEMQRAAIVTPTTFAPLLRSSYYVESIIALVTGNHISNYTDLQPALHLDKFVISGNASSYIGEHFYLQSIANSRYTLYSPQGHKLFEGTIGKIEQVTLNTGQTLTILVNGITPVGSSFNISPISQEALTTALQASLRVSRKGFRERSGLMEVSFANADPVLAQRFLQILVKVYLAHAYDRSAMGRINGLAKLRNDAVVLQQRLNSAENALAAFKEQHGLENIDQSQQEIYQRILQIQGELRTVEKRQKELNATLTSHHPTMIGLTNQIAFYRNEIKASQRALNTLSANQPELNALQSNINIAKTMLDQNTSTAAQLQATVETITGYARLISMRMQEKMSPIMRSILVASLGFLVGMLGYATYLITNMLPMFARIRCARDLRMASVMPVVAELRLKSKKKNKGDAGDDDYGSNIATSSERQWERLEQEMQFLAPTSANKVFLFTSIDGHEGTAVCAQRIAAASAKNRKTLLIDANIMQPAYKDSVAGLSDILTDHGAIKDLVQSTPVANLSILSAGTKTPNYRLLSDAKRIKAILSELSAHYERIIIAFPAITPELCDQGVLKAADILFIMVMRGTSVQELRSVLPACGIDTHSASFFILD